MMTPRPFTIHIPDETLADLRMRLDRVRWPDENPGGGWQYGSDLAYMKALVAYWRENYDWREHEARLNRLRQFVVPVEGIHLHFIHKPGMGRNPLPLLLSHGWPGSIVEFERLIPLLTDPGRFGGDPADAFTVVAPSLPGYTFSFRPDQPRFNIAQLADLFAMLMVEVLGYRRFATAAEAIRFAVEDFPAIRTLGAWMQVGDDRYDSDDIHRLYESSDYPLQRRTARSS